MEFSAEERELIHQAERIIADRLPGQVFVNGTESVFTFLRLHFAPSEREIFGVIFLDAQSRIIAFEILFMGSVNAVEVHPRIVAQQALKHKACLVILVHNHPSGNPVPSKADEIITARMTDALNTLDIRVLDHMIVCGYIITFFAERGMILH